MARDTILVVEDDPDIVELLRYNLEREASTSARSATASQASPRPRPTSPPSSCST